MTSVSSEDSPVREHHASLYIKDGNIVLSATSEGSTTDGARRLVLFRVHKGVLSRQSQVFADMFGLPPEVENASDIYDGAPLVEMPDSVEDVESMLQVLYDPWYVPSLLAS